MTRSQLEQKKRLQQFIPLLFLRSDERQTMVKYDFVGSNPELPMIPITIAIPDGSYLLSIAREVENIRNFYFFGEVNGPRYLTVDVPPRVELIITSTPVGEE